MYIAKHGSNHIFANLYKTQAITCPYNAISKKKLGINTISTILQPQ